MSESLAELLRRSADGVREPRIDVGELVAAAGRRQRHRRLALAAGAAGLVVAIVVGSLAFGSDPSAEPDPAPSPSPSPTVVDPNGEAAATHARPLLYAEGATVHIGDETFEADRPVVFLVATDDGVVFVSQDSYGLRSSDTLWFSDGSTPVAIGTSPTEHVGMFEVSTSDSGSLVVWADATSRTHGWIDQFVVYDTSRREVVGRIPYTGHYDQVLHVDESHVFFNPDSETPGCWVIDIQTCSDPHLFRYDVSSGQTREITRAAYEAVLSTRPRVLVLDEQGGETVFGAGAHFRQSGRQLVPVDGNGDDTVLTRTTGEAVRLRVPSGYTVPAGTAGIALVQWLDDDRIALWAHVAGGDFPPQIGDLLRCRLPDGTCHVAVAASSTLYVVPGWAPGA